LEDWREALDKNQYIAAVLMDLSKAFDCLPTNILHFIHPEPLNKYF
jgi:hypothetical protein